MDVKVNLLFADLRIGDVLDMDGDDFNVTAHVMKEGAFPTCVFDVTDVAPAVIQMIGFVTFHPLSDQLADNFLPSQIQDGNTGWLLYLEFTPFVESRQGCLIHFKLTRAGEVIVDTRFEETLQLADDLNRADGPGVDPSLIASATN